jgi:hypothetical protein
MAGAGIKKFTVGETLSDVEVNEYLMDQTVPVFVNAAARDSAFGGVGEPTLSEGRLCYLQSTKVVQYYNGVTWSDSGQFTVADDAITAAKLADSASVDLDRAVTTNHIRNSAVTTDKLDGTSGSEAVTEAKIRAGAVSSGKLASNLTLAGTTTIAATGKVQQLIEKAVYSNTPLSSTPLSPTLLNVANGAIYYYTAESSGDFAIKITATATGVANLDALMSTQEALTIVVFTSQGLSAKRLTSIAIDSAATVNVRWFGGVSYPSGNSKTLAGDASVVDTYTITVLKRSTDTFDVFASQSSFKA